MADKDSLYIDDDLELPLSPQQIELLKNPANFTWEEEFYILLSPLSQRFDGIDMAPLLRMLGLNKEAVEAIKQAIDSYKVYHYLAEDGTDIPLRGDQDFYADEDLDSKKLEWGKKIVHEILKNDVLRQVWSLRLDELQLEAKINPKEATNIEFKVLKIPEEQRDPYWEMIFSKNKIEGERSSLDLILVKKLQKCAQEYWDRNEVCPKEVLDDVTKEHNKEYKDPLTFLNARQNAVSERTNNQLKELEAKSPSKKSNIPDNVIVDFGEDCGNPDCPVHGNKKAEVTKQPNLKSVPPTSDKPIGSVTKLPIDNPRVIQEKEITSMAPSDKKDSKDEIKFTNVSVQFFEDPSSKKIQLPLGMSLKEGRHWLSKIEEEETRLFQFEYKFTGWFPLDAMWAAYQALAELHGFVHVGDFQGWWGPTPPTMMTISIDYGKTVQIPWGPIEVSGFSAPLTPRIELVQGLPTLVFSAKIKNNERGIADALMVRTQKHLREASIYRGKAIEVDFTMFNPDDFRFDPTKAPVFWDISKVKEDELIFSKDVNEQIRINLFGPIKKTAQARKYKIPLRRGVLIDGKYGVGKTLAASVTAKICSDNGWTFLYLKKLNQLKEALAFAKKYEPCVIFAEDINRITNGKRDADMDSLFNTIDGVDRKNDEVMVVFTTNDLKEIHAGMLRPGRIDSVIRITPPDKFAAIKLVQLYGRGILEPNTNLDKVGTLLAGQIPAIIREAVERAKIAAALDTEDGQDLVVKGDHLILTAQEMLVHAEYLKPKATPKPDLVILGEAMGCVIASGMRNLYDAEGEDKEAISLLPEAVLNEAGRPSNGANTETNWP